MIQSIQRNNRPAGSGSVRGAPRQPGSKLPNPRRLLLASVLIAAILGASVVATVVHAVNVLDQWAITSEIERASVALDVNLKAGAEADAALALRLQKEYLLDGARFAPPQEIRAREISIELPNNTETILAWLPRRLGTGLLLELAPLRLLATALFLAGVGYIMRRLFALAAELEERRRVAHELAGRDPLTGVGNRLSFNEHLQRAFAEGPLGFALLYLDLDDFKRVNDSLGHSAGDELLCKFASRLESFCRPGDLVARMGGDEFAMLCATPMTRAALAELANDMSTALSEPVRIGTTAMSVQVSIGIAVASAEVSTIADLVREADAALYRAKADRIVGFAFADSRPGQLAAASSLRRA